MEHAVTARWVLGVGDDEYGQGAFSIHWPLSAEGGREKWE